MCWFCGKPVSEPEPIGRLSRCPVCGKDLRVCKHCRFFLAGARGDCSEPQGERPADKESATFCDWFSLNPRFREAGPAGRGAAQGAASRAAFENLFGAS